MSLRNPEQTRAFLASCGIDARIDDEKIDIHANGFLCQIDTDEELEDYKQFAIKLVAGIERDTPKFDWGTAIARYAELFENFDPSQQEADERQALEEMANLHGLTFSIFEDEVCLISKSMKEEADKRADEEWKERHD